MLYSAWEGKWEVMAACAPVPSSALGLPDATKSCLLLHILLFGPRGAYSLVPAARQKRRRAQRTSMMARQRHRRLVIDEREHAGSFGRHGRGHRHITGALQLPWSKAPSTAESLLT
jgi:hypothetical protein